MGSESKTFFFEDEPDFVDENIPFYTDDLGENEEDFAILSGMESPVQGVIIKLKDTNFEQHTQNLTEEEQKHRELLQVIHAKHNGIRDKSTNIWKKICEYNCLQWDKDLQVCIGIKSVDDKDAQLVIQQFLELLQDPDWHKKTESTIRLMMLQNNESIDTNLYNRLHWLQNIYVTHPSGYKGVIPRHWFPSTIPEDKVLRIDLPESVTYVEKQLAAFEMWATMFSKHIELVPDATNSQQKIPLFNFVLNYVFKEEWCGIQIDKLLVALGLDHVLETDLYNAMRPVRFTIVNTACPNRTRRCFAIPQFLLEEKSSIMFAELDEDSKETDETFRQRIYSCFQMFYAWKYKVRPHYQPLTQSDSEYPYYVNIHSKEEWLSFEEDMPLLEQTRGYQAAFHHEVINYLTVLEISRPYFTID